MYFYECSWQAFNGTPAVPPANFLEDRELVPQNYQCLEAENLHLRNEVARGSVMVQ